MRLLILIPLLIFAGCVTTKSDIGRANGYCANNGGVASISAKYSDNVKVRCNNTATFSFKSTGQ
jgi:hypothetical protein